jgi:hypothetical protein
MPKSVAQILILTMRDVAVMIQAMLVFGLIIGGGWLLMNWMTRYPRAIKAENEDWPEPTACPDTGMKADLPAVFRMATWIQRLLYVLLVFPPVAASLLIISKWALVIHFLEGQVGVLIPYYLFLTSVIFLLCPFTAWNIYWRRKDFIRFDSGEISYRSGFKSGKLVPGKLAMFRGRSWRSDLTDLFTGQLASSWFLEIIQLTGHGQDGANREQEHVTLDLKAMNLGGKASAIAAIASQVYGDKFLINNDLPAQAGRPSGR